MNKNDRILVTGGRGFVGTNLTLHLAKAGFEHVYWSPDHNLTVHDDCVALFADARPDYVFHLAAQVFGLGGNMTHQAGSFLHNTLINTNVINACVKHKVRKITAMGTVAMYPQDAPNHYFQEGGLWDGPAHDSEWGYANAKRGMLAYLIACKESYGLEFACPLSTNLYGPHDRFNIETGHVLPSLIRKFYEAKRENKRIEVWGNGYATRDFLYVGDAVRLLHEIMDNVMGVTNLVSGTSHPIRYAVDILAQHTGVTDIVWNVDKPIGQVERSYRRPEWLKVQHSLERALKATYDWYAANEKTARKT